MKTRLVPFDVDKAKAGATVVTKDGRPVRIICFDRTHPVVGCITALVTIGVKEEKVVSYHTNGRTTYENNRSEGQSINDLFIKEEIKEISAADLSDLTAGDRVWDIVLNRYGRVTDVHRSSKYNIGVIFELRTGVEEYTYTSGGRYQEHDGLQRLYRAPVTLNIPIIEL